VRLWRSLIFVLALFAGIAPARADQPLLADLSSHLIAITTGFVGTSVTLFGATDGPGDIVAIVRGPERDVMVRQKRHLAGLWINALNVTFASAPSYYAIYSNRPFGDIAPANVAALHQMGIGNVRLDLRDPATPADRTTTFRAALVADQRGQGVYAEYPQSVSFLGDRLFRATISFPANVPIGTYLVEVLLVRNGNVVAGQTTPLVVSEIGVNADLNDFAYRYAALYGIAAVAGAALLGWLSSLPFRDT
jgi:uncharacterized protein (TIGR02186 family)